MYGISLIYNLYDPSIIGRPCPCGFSFVKEGFRFPGEPDEILLKNKKTSTTTLCIYVHICIKYILVCIYIHKRTHVNVEGLVFSPTADKKFQSCTLKNFRIYF